MIYNPSNTSSSILSETFLREVSKVIYEHKSEFDEYRRNNQKLAAVKSIKEYTNGGLRESKEAFDLWFAGQLPNYLLKDRKEKLEILAKKPLIEELIEKIRKTDSDKLSKLFMKLSVDELFNIDDIFTETE